ncbi:MAG: oxidoreductase [Rhodobacteraceae bacterium]|nr:oxidoreductase [Paracoccaceae bacterium]
MSPLSADPDESIGVTLRSVQAETPRIRRFVLATDGPAPSWSAGAHLRVHLPDGGDRPYSLVALPALGEDELALGVLLEENSTGGSRFMHGLEPGARLRVSGLRNSFPLHEGPEAAILFAGGIGITPMLSMAADLSAAGRPFRLHYAGRSLAQMAFVPELRNLCGRALRLHPDDDAQTRLDIDAALATMPEGAHVYVCGPRGMIEAVTARARAAGIEGARLHVELFTAEAPKAGDGAFEIEIASTGEVLTVAADQSIIDALEAAGHDVMYDCRRGDCGICQCGVLAGEPDHRDVILTESERAAGQVMQICVSRARSPRLVLDL